MVKKIFFYSLLLSSLISFSQEVVNSTPVKLKKNRDIFQIVNNEKKETTLFISDKEKVKAIRLNEQMQITDSISAPRPNLKTYVGMVGYNSANANVRLYWSSDDYKEIFSQLYDFDSRKIITQEYVLSLKDEKVLQKFSNENTFYLLTVIKRSSTFKLHIFDKDGKHTENSIVLKDFHFYNSVYKRTDLYGVLEENLLPFEYPFSLKYITPENPTSITDAAYKRKCYFDGNEIVVTIDSNIDYTQAIILDLKSFTATEKLLKHPIIQSEYRSELNSNSFYFDKKLYQIKTSSDHLYFNVKDLNDTILKAYTATAAKPIEFKNSEISQEGGDFGGSKRVLENSSQFIRKLNNMNSGLSCYHIGDKTLISLGSVSEVRATLGQAVLGNFGAVGSIVSSIVYNPTLESFNSYERRKVVKIDGLFDKNDNHLTENLQPLAFDKIRNFFDKNTDVSSQTLFKMTNNYYVGYYDNKAKEYVIRKFAD
ncbi:hypothetical protein SAMN05444397_105286 [Flavobacterium aquidurense]|uniref:6-bladed beta-propeller protein n=1 Tax=Flavobacterium frigidimaris TaxID=262320 RepID=A0ABX4BWF6_FLAFR|nr:hypothetical protein [Flavobacterium frigidimaris]OXA81871.1 hypothetical protein B0A65_02230 [Flavobacterium frigidimaris]SDZ34231.1 hypothetical protein SAMN05444397_105286 [Flavobacterium aquidurense]